MTEGFLYPHFYFYLSIMAGHNKWSKVKHIKARVDGKRSKMFSKFSHEITIAARDGGGDPDMNPRLRTAVDGAKSQSMPKDNIERAIKKGTGELGGAAIQEMVYEGYGPNGIAMLVEVATDNINRSAAETRVLFAKNGGNIGTPGSVNYLFEKKGEVRIQEHNFSEDELMEIALEADAEDCFISEADEQSVFICEGTQLNAMANAIREKFTLVGQKIISVATTPVIIEDIETAKKALHLYEILDDYPDTMNVFTNFELADSVLQELDAAE